jgi:hypothetical protein
MNAAAGEIEVPGCKNPAEVAGFSVFLSNFAQGV